jgi:hypothetical protein
MRQFFYVLAVFGLTAPQPSLATAGSIFLDVPGITGESPTPGHPAAMAAQSITVLPGGFSLVRQVDVASSQIATAVSRGSSFFNASALFYNGTPSGSPEAALSFHDVIASSFQLLGGLKLLERDGFNSATQYSMFLELPGITGEGATPGHPGVLALQSFTFDGQHFSVVRQLDSATPQVALAVAKGTSFSSASVFFYDSTPLDVPVTTLVFQDVVASSFHIDGIITPQETDGFVFANLVTEPGPGERVPEPSSALLLSLGSACLACFVRRRGLRRTAWKSCDRAVGRSKTTRDIEAEIFGAS